MRTHLKHAVAACLLAALLVPAAAGAVYQRGDRPAGIRSVDGPALTPAQSSPAADSTPRIVREVRTVTSHDGNPTVAVVLGALSLSVALAGTGYVALRVRPLLRS